MKREALIFDRPAELQANAPAEARGIERDEARLLVSTSAAHVHTEFRNLAQFLRPGDLLVVNQSATIPASLPAVGDIGPFTLHLSTDFGRNLWLAEPRWSATLPGPLPLKSGDEIYAAGVPSRLVATYPGLPQLWFVQFQGDLRPGMNRLGKPIRYGYLQGDYDLSNYQTVFARVPGSAEMPSAAYAFTPRTLESLRERGVGIASIVLHTGVSSLEVDEEIVEEHPLYPEPFHVPAATAQAVNAARRSERRVIAVGTTVVRALESAWDGHEVRAAQGFTRVYVHPAKGVHTVDGLLTGLHD